MFKYDAHETVFPVAYGNEEETGMMDNLQSFYDEPYKLSEDLLQYIPNDLLGCKDFLTNGFKLYAGGSADSAMATNIERATPECATPQELVTYIRASELLIQKVVENFVTAESGYDESTINSRIHRRVVDSAGNRKGCHDNFGIYAKDHDSFLLDTKLSLTNHLATRSFVTGAGHVKSKELRYAQKINGLSGVVGYGYTGTMMRMDQENNDKTSRLEIRCNDINISDWATLIRIGSTALVLAINNTPLADQLKTDFSERPIDLAKRHNQLHLYKDLRIEKNKIDFSAVDYQQKIAELALDKLQLYIDELPLEYFEIAKELYEYCEDFKTVAEQKATIELLADRADWAAKFVILNRHVQEDEKYGIKRRVCDIEGQAIDLRYDYISVTGSNGELQPTIHGLGYKLRNRNFFKKTIPQNNVLKALKQAPTTTRAHLRANLLQQYEAEFCDWNVVTLNSGERVELYDVRQTKFDPSYYDKGTTN